ncbi:cytochrome P450 [Halorussus gelatinilyticus]|uniref:Cytochrome P450 n=1 Tax=Halorussus gelatinilyticus TaxID=2937524 RepID=A0A8U0IHV0_9EURY|nr:cytochrome P450 [Halorussus gelatinilyticus]UPW00680.1 cytochrome P450 [Halorussus gelatinilyticus]
MTHSDSSETDASAAESIADATARDPDGNPTLRDPPKLDAPPLVGNTLQFARDPFGFYDRLAARDEAVRYEVARQEFCTVFEPAYVQRILVEDDEKFVKAEMFQEAAAGFAEQGLLLTEGEVWRDQRVRIQPAFTPEKIRSYTDAMVRYAEQSGDRLADGEVVNVEDAMSELTLKILAKSLFDVDVAGRREVVREAAAALNARGDAGGASAFLPDWVPTPKNRRFERAMADFEAMVDDLIAERRAGGADGDDSPDDLLSILLTAEGPDGTTMDDAVVRDQMVTFLFAGHETTALALTYAWHLLGRNPDALERLRAELDAELGDRRATMADLPALDYTERVVEEALRLFPPAYVLFREPTEDVQLGPYRVREGTAMTIPIFEIHRDERFYDAPDEFRPERWTEAFEADLPEYAYLPFGGGPRHCIGMRFAMTELQLVLATLVREVVFDPTYDGDPGPLDGGDDAP